MVTESNGQNWGFGIKLTDSSYLTPKARGVVEPATGYRKVVAVEALHRDELVIMWGGRIITASQVPEIPRDLSKFITQMDDGLFMFSNKDEPPDWINHSCDPNCGMFGQISIVAMRDVSAGEELTMDYAMTEDNHFLHEQFECHCGAPSCRKRMHPQDWRLPELQKKYRGYFSPFIQRKINNDLLP
jgi:hypothetical protein